MDFKTYQERAADTALYPNAGNNYVYPVLGLSGEAGEIANKVKKISRDHGGVITDETRSAIKAELGDVLWYVARVAAEFGIDLQTIAEENIVKLASRKERGTLHGEGDTR